MDTIAEVTAVAGVTGVTNRAPAAVGRSGGAAAGQVLTKGGTRECHGSGYVFIRNESLNARGWNADSEAASAAIRKST